MSIIEGYLNEASLFQRNSEPTLHRFEETALLSCEALEKEHPGEKRTVKVYRVVRQTRPRMHLL